jgi:ribosome-associated protein
LPKKRISEICHKSLHDNKAVNIISLNVKKISSFADEIIIATANSNRHALSVSEKLVSSLKENQISIIGVEGKSTSGWVLVDCGDVVINIMRQEQREFYDLESLWGAETISNKYA